MATQFDLFGQQHQSNRCRVTLDAGGLLLHSPYIRELVEAIKSLPYAERRWDGARKVWIVDPTHGRQLVDWIALYANETIALPAAMTTNSTPVMRLLEVRYVGACKLRDDGSSTAFGLVGSDWSVIFPETVLRTWFEGGFDLQEQPSAEQTLYQVLGVKKAASEDEIKTAYRRMALIWHPDHARNEPNAHEIFIRIQGAFEVLSNTGRRARYDVGLSLQASLQASFEQRNERPPPILLSNGYRSPLRSGLIMLMGIEKVGRIEVSKILVWSDIVNSKGQTLVVSWPLGAKQPAEKWV